MRVLVCGGRDYNDEARVAAEFCNLFQFCVGEDGDPSELTIVHGDARGADRLAADEARRIGFAVESHPANWTKHKKAAGPIRNQEMLDTGIDLVLAFPGGDGTADMIRRAKKAGVEVAEVKTVGDLKIASFRRDLT